MVLADCSIEQQDGCDRWVPSAKAGKEKRDDLRVCSPDTLLPNIRSPFRSSNDKRLQTCAVRLDELLVYCLDSIMTAADD